eukprot:202243-Prymnesium_polylepis.2
MARARAGVGARGRVGARARVEVEGALRLAPRGTPRRARTPPAPSRRRRRCCWRAHVSSWARSPPTTL